MKAIRLFTLSLFVAGGAFAQDKVAITMPAVVDAGAAMREGLRECAIPERVGAEIFARVSERVSGAMAVEPSVPPPGDALLLKVSVVSATGAGGGGWSGPKSVVVRADVMRGAQTLTTKIFTRSSSGGAFGGVTGTCPIFGRIAVALGRDVAAWAPGELAVARSAPAAAEAPKEMAAGTPIAPAAPPVATPVAAPPASQ
jgi:hypothetical protein